ncbi:hypothetical protein TSTA_029890 [Talaromyces stipitatus ATCC 10500]|uniref:Uncharacterized protein n=1 Tax=Talaromyces stipitatus (strain ATCC 10500 / CBS 375.48 / QM 6759 / NRRL 1006) TaxID=441959 RepID=B8M5B2_TALSN|nr:uncharacterized protein TSTA_029890 [Talaromyces stipitatus ATCC 10500]EED19718.1 hypothetical protein TSTA_029890 [Talaromyces stipitatus ATCC 10500]
MTWLTGTDAASIELQDAILANNLVNIRGANDSWYEIDRLNLEMKRIMRTALTASYCIELQNQIDHLSRRFLSSKHTSKEATLDIFGLAIRLCELRSLQQMQGGRDADFIPKDLFAAAVGTLIRKKVALFNQNQVADPALEEPAHTPISMLGQFTTDPDADDIGDRDSI